MRWKTTIKGLSLIISLVALSFPLLCGCNRELIRKQIREYSKEFVKTFRQPGAGD